MSARVGWWLFVLAWLLAACQGEPAWGPAPAPTGPAAPTATPAPRTRVHWQVQVPPNTPPDAQVVLMLLDEVTGLTVAPRRYPLEPTDQPGQWALTLAVEAYQRLTYRFELHTPDRVAHPEVTLSGEPVRYRSGWATPEALLVERIAAWQGLPQDPTPGGRLQGRLTDAVTGAAVADVFVFAGGLRTLTDARGEFLLEGLPPGLHTVFFWHPDGRYAPFQQQAQIGPEATTPVELALQPTTEVPVKFVLTPPDDTVPGSPIRLVGDLYRLGNTYADLPGGQSVLASRAPTLQPRDDGRYEVVLSLPVGVPVRYKYTLGDGLTNAERTPQGLRTRLLYLQGPAVLEERVATWRWPQVGPVWLEVEAPPLPQGERVSVQFRPANETHWHTALPMWPLANGHWGFLFYGPMDPVQATAYRYCRNEQCQVAPEAGEWGAAGRLLRSSILPQDRRDRVTAWRGYTPLAPVELVVPPLQPKGDDFVTGVAWAPDYAPHWQPHLPAALAAAAGLRARVVVLEPRWAGLNPTPYPRFGPVVGEDPLAADVAQWLRWGQEQGLSLWLYPRLRLQPTPEAWWNAAATDDFAWWQAWFERYARFVLHFAALAQEHRAAALVLGGPEVWPALPAEDALAEPTPQTLGDAADRWRGLVAAVRQRFDGQVWWAMDARGPARAPSFADAFDGLYLRWPPPRLSGEPTDAALAQAHAAALDRWQPVAEQTGLPVVLAVAYPSARGAETGCPQVQGRCASPAALRPGEPLAAAAVVDLAAQMRLYQFLLPAVEERPWVRGVIAADFFPPVEFQGPGASVHGKPAGAMLWYWFRQWQGEGAR